MTDSAAPWAGPIPRLHALPHEITGLDPHGHLAGPGKLSGEHGPLRIGIGGPVGSGKTALVAALCRVLGDRLEQTVLVAEQPVDPDVRGVADGLEDSGGFHALSLLWLRASQIGWLEAFCKAQLGEPPAP